MIALENLHISFVQSLEEITASEWDMCNTTHNPFTSYAFLHALEQSNSVGDSTGWSPYHMIIRSSETVDATIAACMPMYLKGHSYGEYVFDHGWADAYERAGGQYYPKLQSCAPFTPATGQRLLINNNCAPEHHEALKSALLGGLQQITQKLGLSSAHLTFVPEDEAITAEQNGFLIRHDQQFHWYNRDYESFESFLAQLSSRKRKQIKKERRTVHETDIQIETITGQEINEAHWDAFYEFYIDTGARKWGQPYLTRSFFSAIGKAMPDKIVLFLCKRADRYIAGALNFLGPDTIYGRQWGCIEDHPYLHFETCYYRAIEYAIKHKLRHVEAGAQGAHKLARGYEPVRTFSAHYIQNDSFQTAVAHFLEQEREGIAGEINYLSTKTPFKKDT
ncbi:GNAT family N-acetyltransferase [Kordiimonas aquimaris]|uniref:GNAT family N-acetyltransferase n=1 Tax=Kordiimonas aquimaris TaxID=707591 RepID=UPI0021CFC846|nr:GNAT family N-acetyltransferase [Kordiimonas aquimaris]